MKHHFVIPELFLQSSQNAAKAIHPAMRSFHNPTMSPELAVFNCLSLLFPQLDMRFIATSFQTNFQPVLCREYLPLQQTPRAEAHSHRSSVTPSFPLSVGLRPVFLNLRRAILSCSHPSTTMTSQWPPAITE